MQDRVAAEFKQMGDLVEYKGYVRLYDYRCFRREAPATLQIGPGFTGFIGANNAGKSTLIRCLRELRPVLEQLGNEGSMIGNFSTLLEKQQTWSPLAPMHDTAEIVAERDDPRCVVEIGVEPASAQSSHWISAFRFTFKPDASSFTITAVGSDGVDIRRSEISSLSPPYVNTSRGLTCDIRPLAQFIEALTDTLFIGAFRNAINEGAGIHYDIHVGTSFIDQWNNWKVGTSIVQTRAIQRVTEEIRRLIGADSLEINSAQMLKTMQVTINGRSQRLQELGSGIAQLIVVLGNAMIRKPAFIIIDEPELHLHPGLQLDFLTSLGAYAKCGVLYATHSIGLARALSDKCFTVQQKGDGSVVRELEQTKNYAEFLGSLGIAGLSEIGWDRLLLVEGPKDVRTAQQFLRLFGKDRHTVVLPLGGDGLVNGGTAHQLEELLRLCPKIFALVDSERGNEGAIPIKARQEFKANCDRLHIDCHITERRAIENYLTDRALKAEFGEEKAALGPFDALPKDGTFIGKGDGWRVARRMSRQELDASDLGKFFARI